MQKFPLFNLLIDQNLLASLVSWLKQFKDAKKWFYMVFYTFYAITPWFLIKFQKLKKENLQKILLFHLLINQKVLALLVKWPELFKDAKV